MSIIDSPAPSAECARGRRASVKRRPAPDPRARTDFFGVLDFLEDQKPGGPWRLHALSRRGDPERSAVEVLNTHAEVVEFLRAYHRPDCDQLYGCGGGGVTDGPN